LAAPRGRLPIWTLVWALAWPVAAQAAGSEGIVVDEVYAGFGGAAAGLKPGDVLLEWSRAASPPRNPSPARGPLRSQFDLVEAELEEAPRGELTILGTRGGAPLVVRMPAQDWVVSVSPPLGEADRKAYEEARALVGGEAWERGLAAWRELARAFAREGPDPRASWLFLKLARFAGNRASWAAADEAYRDGLAAAEGDPAAEALLHGFSAASLEERLDWAGAVDGYARALALYRSRAADSLREARVLDQLGGVDFKHGDLQAADEHMRRALEIREAAAPQSAAVANSLHNLGLVAAARGDLAGAEEYFRRALEINERLAPSTLGVSLMLHNLGSVAEKRGDLAAAEGFYARGLEYWRQHAPESLGMASGLVSLAGVSLKRGRMDVALETAVPAIQMAERLAPGGIVSGDAALCLGDIALAAGELDTAEGWYDLALRIREAQQPGSGAEAEAHQRLGALRRRRQRPGEALPLYLRALDVLDRQTRTLGGTDEVRSRFAALYAPYYHETIDLLMELGRPEEAFHVLERYRARAFLALLAERDLVFTADIPESLDRERRALRAEHDRAFAALAAAAGPAAGDARQALLAVRRRQGELEARVRAASPRLAALQHPEALDVAGTRAALDPGTLLLSYAVADTAGYLFAIGPGRDDFVAVKLAATLPKLRADVGRFRRLLQVVGPAGDAPLRALAGELGTALLGPVADRIGRADRLLVLPDGPLHLVPFAALADPSAGAAGRYLVEARPVHTAASATVFAEVGKTRRPQRPARLFALGDPDYGPAGRAAAARTSLRERGLELLPLPGTRREVEAIERLYPEGSRVFLGAEASEDRARKAGREPSLVHFASHALADAASPLDSSLVLSLPAAWKPGQPNGLLQAWEILEQVRLDADLVTLSACGTALGQEVSGEGVLGLTRAFQYAGARSVLASLWAVSDESTAFLMDRFYRGLREGRTKDAALRAAQLEMLRGSRSHPSLWAAFQLSGDWK
jgi:CHAT domain-containing protein/Tfp pilus assembly protein PilF